MVTTRTIAPADLVTGGVMGFDRPNHTRHLVVEGDSKARLLGDMGPDSALYWAITRYGIHIVYDPIADNCGVGGSRSDARTDRTGTNVYGATVFASLTEPNRMAAVDARIAAGADTALLYIGANDASLWNEASGGTIANVEKWINGRRLAGCKYFILMAISPQGDATAAGTQAIASQMTSVNNALAKLATNSADVFFVDGFSALVDETSTIANPLGTYTGSIGAWVGQSGAAMKDKLHESSFGAYQVSSVLGPVLQKISPPNQTLRLPTQGDIFTPAVAPRANLISNSRFLGSGGNTSGATNGTLTLTAPYPASWRLDGNMQGITIAVTDVVDPAYIQTVFGKPTGATVKRLTFSGTPTADTTMEIRPTAAPGNGGTGLNGAALFSDLTAGVGFRSRGALYANALLGLKAINLRIDTSANDREFGNTALTIASTPSIILPQLDGLLTFPALSSFVPTPGFTFIQPKFVFYLSNGVPVSGSIDLIMLDLRQDLGLPAPTP